MVCDKLPLAAALGAVLFLAGCGSAGSASSGPSIGEGPEGATKAFLEAVRIGDDKTAATLLTPVARKKTAEKQMVVAPPGSDTATYSVGDVQYVDDGAHVASDWTDVDAEGRMHTDRIVWILRQESEGWRIAGMATKVFPDRPPVVLNFEDPDDMLRQQQSAEAEMAKREDVQPAKEARQKADPPKSIR
jgi:hypothetical protein